MDRKAFCLKKLYRITLFTASFLLASVYLNAQLPSVMRNSSIMPSVFRLENPLRDKIETGFMLGSTYGYSSFSGGIGSLNTFALGNAAFTFNEKVKMNTIFGYKYSPFTAFTGKTLYNPVESGGILAGAKLSITPSDSFKMDISYDYGGIGFEENPYTDFSSTVFSERALTHRFNMALEKTFNNNITVKIDASYYKTVPTVAGGGIQMEFLE